MKHCVISVSEPLTWIPPGVCGAGAWNRSIERSRTMSFDEEIVSRVAPEVKRPSSSIAGPVGFVLPVCVEPSIVVEL